MPNFISLFSEAKKLKNNNKSEISQRSEFRLTPVAAGAVDARNATRRNFFLTLPKLPCLAEHGADLPDSIKQRIVHGYSWLLLSVDWP